MWKQKSSQTRWNLLPIRMSYWRDFAHAFLDFVWHQRYTNIMRINTSILNCDSYNRNRTHFEHIVISLGAVQWGGSRGKVWPLERTRWFVPIGLRSSWRPERRWQPEPDQVKVLIFWQYFEIWIRLQTDRREVDMLKSRCSLLAITDRPTSSAELNYVTDYDI